MNNGITEKYEVQAGILKALAHPTRLFIVDRLRNSELCVNEITGMVGADMSTVSKHLSILKQAQIVEIDKRGNSIYYRLKMKCVLNFFSCVNQVLENKIKCDRKAMA